MSDAPSQPGMPGDPPVPQAHRSARREMAMRAALAIALVALTAAVFAPVRHHQFVDLDDWAGILWNPDIRAASLREALVTAFTRPMISIWSPLTILSFQLDWALYGPDPTGYLVENVALHALSAVLLFRVLVALTGATFASAFVAAVFAAHPLHVESVAWASERKDALSGVFFMLTLLAYVHYVRRPESRLRYLFVVLCLGLGLLAKPMLVTLPCVLLLLDYWPLRRFDRAAIREKLPMFAIVAVACFIAVHVQARFGALSYGIDIPLGMRLFNAVHSYAAYLGQTLWPEDLAAFYAYPLASLRLAPTAWRAGVLLALTAAACLCWRSRPYAITGWLWFLGTLVPVIGIVQVGAQGRADRYMYLPLIGLAIAVAFGARDLVGASRVRRWIAGSVAAGVIAALAVVASAQVRTWRDSFTLFEHALVVEPDSAFPHVRLGMIRAMNGVLEPAREYFQRAFELDPAQQPEVVRQLDSMAGAHAQMGRFEHAVRTAEFAISLAEATGQAQRAQEIRARLSAFRAGRLPTGGDPVQRR